MDMRSSLSSYAQPIAARAPLPVSGVVITRNEADRIARCITSSVCMKSVPSQACAAMPGLSRSGSTIATGLLLGNKKAAVAQFSFLMVLAPILGETLLQATSGDLTAGIAAGPLIAGFLASFITGCLACKFMIEVVKRGKLIWFAVYCTVAGLVSITSYFC